MGSVLILLERPRASFETRPADAPCISSYLIAAVVDGSPWAPRADKPAPELGAASAGSLSPNSRQGRPDRTTRTSPHARGRDMKTFVGIDVSKDRLDVHLRPSGESFALAREGEALAGWSSGCARWLRA